MTYTASGVRKLSRKENLLLIAAILIGCQYLAAHLAGWANSTEGANLLQLKLSALEVLPDYFIKHPFDVTSFEPMYYMLIYILGALIYSSVAFYVKPPRAEMKGEEHGSNDFMTKLEIKQFRESRILPNFDYCEDVRETAHFHDDYLKKCRKRGDK